MHVFRVAVRCAVLGLLALVGGCAVRVSSGPEVAPYLNEHRPSTIRVFVAGGDSVNVWQPKVRNDSLVGLLPKSAGPGQPLKPFERPLAEIDSITRKKFSPARSAAAFAGPIIAAAWIILLVGF